MENNLLKLRQLMNEHRIDAYIVGTHDPHNTEYLSDYYKSREWITGFTGSQGIAIITQKDAFLWTDGRYFIQAEKQMRDRGFKLMKIGIPGYPDYKEWLVNNLDDYSVLGIWGAVFPYKEWIDIKNSLIDKNIIIKDDKDLIGILWDERPLLPQGKVFVLDVEYSGRSVEDKLLDIRKSMVAKKAEFLLVTTLDDVAWLYNIRGTDLPQSLSIFSYALITDESAYLYIDKSKIDDITISGLSKSGVEIRRYYSIFDDLIKIKNSSIWCDLNSLTLKMFNSIDDSNNYINEILPTTMFKAIKNEVEIAQQKKAYYEDGLAIVRTHHWLKSELVKGNTITEIDVENKLEEYRNMNSCYLGKSFDTISAYGPNAAMMHYRALEDDHSVIERKGFHLMDCGAQFPFGTTDTTRAIVVGDLTQEQKVAYTLALKGNINLSRAKFLKGTTGHSLDILARYYLWQNGIDYKSGTGHGIGFAMNVHEGPHRISPIPNSISMVPGMIVSNEPGVYITGDFGIRLENILVVEDFVSNEHGTFYKFDTLSYLPFEPEAILPELLSSDEIKWLNDYNAKVYDLYEKALSDEEKDWLAKATETI
ncbi:MAG: aminopeptidase P family protein [Tissierellia bacterium]|nr:aminopeptidase P family protein [Tissierellia bacterium]